MTGARSNIRSVVEQPAYGMARREDVWIPQHLFLPGNTGLLVECLPKANFYTDAAHTTPVVNENDPIGSVKYKISDAYATQSTAGSRPSWSSDGLSTDGTADYLDTGINASLSGTILVAGTAVAGANFMGASAATNGRLYLGLNGSGYLGGGIGNNSISTIVINGSVVGSYGVYAMSWDRSTVKLYKNGVKGYEGAQSGDVTTAYSIFLGCVNASGTAAGFIQASGVKSWLFIDRVLSDAEIQKTTRYYGGL